MGEAKRRRELDPNFGHPKRGIIISSPMEIEGRRLRMRGIELEPQELRFWLLYWDRLVWPSTNFIGSDPTSEETFLVRERLLSRPNYRISGDVAQGMAGAFATAFTEHDKAEPGLWAMGIGENSYILRDAKDVQPDKGVAVELLRAIPVPDRDVPLSEILEFKARRKDELYALRAHVDDIVAEISAADDPITATAAAAAKIDKTCTDLLRVGSEWQFPMRLSSIKTTLELRPFQTVAGAFAGLAAPAVLPGAAGLVTALAGAAVATAPALKISADIGWQGLKKDRSPFLFVSRFHKELF